MFLENNLTREIYVCIYLKYSNAFLNLVVQLKDIVRKSRMRTDYNAPMRNLYVEKREKFDS